jgi:glycosyltransferase involved in cell wall biosynthesis
LSTLIDAVAVLDRDHFAFDLHLIGEGPLRRNLESRVARLELGSSVTFHGPVAPAKLADWFRAADATVLPSLSEGMPNVLIESMACGTPFVASDVGGIPALAARGLDVLAPPGDARALASALRGTLTAWQDHTQATRSIVPTSWRDQAMTISRVLENAVAASMERTAAGPAPVEPALAAHRSKAAGD